MIGGRLRMSPRRWSGTDVEAYITVVVALAVCVLNLVDVVDSKIVSAATLSILALLSFDAFTGRRLARRAESAVQELTRAVNGVRRSAPHQVDLVTEPTTWCGLDRARDVRLVGVTLARTVRSHLSELERCLAAGGTVRMVIIDPTSTAGSEAARRNGLPDGAEVFEHRLRPTIDLLRYLATRGQETGRLEVRCVPFVPSFGIVMVDPESTHGTVTVDVYSHRPGGREPSLALTPDGDPQWYRHFRSEFDQIWASARPLNIDDGFVDTRA